jgi:hypothetical protein
MHGMQAMQVAGWLSLSKPPVIWPLIFRNIVQLLILITVLLLLFLPLKNRMYVP